ncbi:helix-turn-helix domain-containing protein [Paraburkholderia sp. 2C]
MEPEKRDPIACQIIDGLDGTVAVADLCEIDPSAVSQWRYDGIPKPRMQFLRLARPNFDWSVVPASYYERRARRVKEGI